jgi:hypothetical protein
VKKTDAASAATAKTLNHNNWIDINGHTKANSVVQDGQGRILPMDPILFDALSGLTEDSNVA